MKSLYFKIIAFFTALVVKHGLVRAWSRLYRLLWERKWRNYPLELHDNIDSVVNTMKKFVWLADGPRQLWDAVSSANTVQAYLDGKLVREDGFDCDEAAIYSSTCIEKALIEKRLQNRVKNVYMMSVFYANGWKVSGHWVCLIQWENNLWSWMDYRKPSSGLFRPYDAAWMIAKHYGGDALVSYEIVTPDLRWAGIR